MTSTTRPKVSYLTSMWRGWRQRCPRCGVGRLFGGWFQMRKECDQCGLDLVREPGFYLGSVYVNYGLTAVLMTATYFILFFTTEIDPQRLLWGLALFTVVFPVLFFRSARGLWLAFDQFWDPDAEKPGPNGPA